jgi:hypothetical protein
MSTHKRAVVAFARQPRRSAAIRLPEGVMGQLTGLGDGGEPLVDFPGNERGPLAARTIVDVPNPPVPGRPVLLVFENGDPALPIVVGFVRATAWQTRASAAAGTLETAQDLHVAGRSLVVDAQQEIVLRCGAGSITLRADGTVVVKGRNLLSRSTGTNRIKGAAVRIN